MSTQSAKKQRTCIACGKQAGKGELLRIVRASDGSAAFDGTGRAAGRGAYVCSAACLASAVKAHKLERALRTKLDQQQYDRIEAEIASALRQSQERVEE